MRKVARRAKDDGSGRERVQGTGMNPDFQRERAKRVREIAEHADPLTRRRLLDLAAQYDLSARVYRTMAIARPNALARRTLCDSERQISVRCCPEPKDRERSPGRTMMIEKNLAKFRAHRNNVDRYKRLLRTRLTELEQEFIEKRLREELAILEALAPSMCFDALTADCHAVPVRMSTSAFLGF